MRKLSAYLLIASLMIAFAHNVIPHSHSNDNVHIQNENDEDLPSHSSHLISTTEFKISEDTYVIQKCNFNSVSVLQEELNFVIENATLSTKNSSSISTWKKERYRDNYAQRGPPQLA